MDSLNKQDLKNGFTYYLICSSEVNYFQIHITESFHHPSQGQPSKFDDSDDDDTKSRLKIQRKKKKKKKGHFQEKKFLR